MNFHPAAPILRVANLRASLTYYVETLGFAIDWEAGPIASVTRDRCCLFLTEGDQGHPGAWVWIGVADAEALHTELLAKGARIRQPPTNFQWSLELQAEDLDGNVLRLGSDSIEGRPFGPWKDMHGRLWAYRGEDRWERM
ncbi:MAG TPA: VOC family protein [Thermoanaerobaculia bacterium]